MTKASNNKDKSSAFESKTTAKTPRKKSAARKKSSSSKPKQQKKPLKSKLWSLCWKLGLVGFVILASYCIYLDQIIARKFEGQKWYLPAQIFSRSMAIYSGAPVNHHQMIAELKLLGYRKVAHPRQIGEFSASATKVDLWRRPFFHPQGTQTAQRVLITFDSQGIDSVKRLPDNRELAVFHLEPMLLDRIIPNDGVDRLFVPTSNIPQHLIDALILTEDRDFYSHYGINPMAIARAAVVNITAGRTIQGGSTLTQQLAKNFFLTSQRSLSRKVREALMAIIIDARYSKQNILEAYLNEVYMGQDKSRAVHGVGLASQFYFGRPIAELTLAQQAFLVAIIKGPSFYNPWRYPERVQDRRDLVLRLLLEGGKISSEQYEAAALSPLGLRKSTRAVRQKLPAFFAEVRRELADRYGSALLKTSGLKVYTTLDPIAQESAEAAVANTMKKLARNNKSLQIGMVVTDKYNAGIAAMVGDKNPEFKGYNRAVEIRRPIGSLVKPFVYVTALAQPNKYNLATPLKDEPITLSNGQGNTWSPQNVDKKYRQQVPLISALSQSMNVPTVNLGMALGTDEVAMTLGQAGWKEQISTYPSMLLGAIDGSPLMVAQVYQTLADGGRYRRLTAITDVLDANNHKLAGRSVIPTTAIEPAADYLIKYAMTQVVAQGTAKRLGRAFPYVTLAGKTGTSNDSRDSWFAGFDERNVAAIWVGRDDNGKTNLYGSSGAMAVYQEFLVLRPPIGLRMTPVNGVISGYFQKNTGIAMEADCPNIEKLPTLSVSFHPIKNCGNPLNWWQKLM